MKSIRRRPDVITLSLLLLSSPTIPSLSKLYFAASRKRRHQRRKPFQNLQRRSISQDNNVSIQNCTCHFITQPLDHFSASFSPTYRQRYCIYDKYSSNDDDNSSSSSPSPLFFYAGNESPLEQYINHTGLIWQLAPHHNATIIFAEHRYEGLSLPPPTTPNCRSHATSAQALADYASLLSHLDGTRDEKPPVIVFGGSYGGMLSSWMRMRYPSSVAGAVASSAPIWGLPQTYPALDGAWRAVARALTEGREGEGDGGGGCFDNLLAGWVLIYYWGRSGGEGRRVLTEVFESCGEMRDDEDVAGFLEGLQSVWFDMAEGDYPFASSYIVSAVGPGVYELPPWVMSEACERVDGDYGVSVEGNKSDVRFVVRSSVLELVVDWDVVTPGRDYTDEDLLQSEDVLELLSGIKDAVSLWYNVTGVETCLDIFNTEFLENQHVDWESSNRSNAFSRRNLENDDDCQTQIASEGCWDSLCCNESLNLVNYLVRGIGNDFFWPPNVDRNFSRTDVINDMSQDQEEYCSSLYSQPVTNDPLSQNLDDYYGGLRIGMHSNIIFSNGLHDPWSSAGVYPSGIVPDKGGPMISNVTEDGTVVSLVLEKGGHHLDLMFANENDPPEVTLARELMDSYIGKWIEEWTMQKCVGSVCETRTGGNESR